MASRAATTRAIAIVLAVILSLGGAFLLWRYVSGADQRALEGAEPVDVFIATGGIPQGMTAQTAVSSELIELDQIPAANRPEGAITSLEQISGLAATAPILPGEVVQQGRFGDPTLASANVDVPPDRVGMSLVVSVPEGVSGYLTRGDRIGVIGHQEVELVDTQFIGPDGEVIGSAQSVEDEVTAQSKYIATDVEVLAVGRRIVTTDAEGNTADAVEQTEQVLLTVAITPADAERLSYMYREGFLYFTLLPEGFEVPDTDGVTAETVFE